MILHGEFRVVCILIDGVYKLSDRYKHPLKIVRVTMTRARDPDPVNDRSSRERYHPPLSYPMSL